MDPSRADLLLRPLIQKMDAAGVPALTQGQFARHFTQLVAGSTGEVAEADISPVDDIPNWSGLESASCSPEILARAVVIKLNGGLGTTMGLSKAKSLLPLKDGATFLDILAQQAAYVSERAGAHVPLVFMNSNRTHEDTLDALKGYPALREGGLPLGFVQATVPKVLKDGLGPAEWPSDPSRTWCPPGHGGIYSSLKESGLLDSLLDADYQYAFVSNADNLGAVLDTGMLGWFAASGAPFLMEVCPRTAAMRKGGHLARRHDGRLILREKAQVPEADMEAFQDHQRHGYFNTNNIWVNLSALKARLDGSEPLSLPLIRNEKLLVPTDPSSPPVYQLESAMGAAIEAFDGSLALLVPRTRFAPVKTTGDLLLIRSDAFALDETASMVPAAGCVSDKVLVSLDDRYYKHMADLDRRFPDGVPSMKGCSSLKITGDVTFGRGVVLKGDVVIETGATPQMLPAGSVVEGHLVLS